MSNALSDFELLASIVQLSYIQNKLKYIVCRANWKVYLCQKVHFILMTPSVFEGSNNRGNALIFLDECVTTLFDFLKPYVRAMDSFNTPKIRSIDQEGRLFNQETGL